MSVHGHQVDDASVGAVLDQLTPHLDIPLVAMAARTIRRLTEVVTATEIERDAAELSRWAYAAEIARMNDHRANFEARRAQKAIRR